MDLKTERVEIAVGDATMGAYLARPADDEPRPGVVVFMEIFGVNDHIRDVTDRVAAEGYVALAPDFFHRSAPGMEVGYDAEGMQQGMMQYMQLQADQMVADARAAVSWLDERPEVQQKRIGCMGFCIGGHMAYVAAAETDVRATASYYGGGIAAPQGPGGGASPISRTPKIGGRIVCFFGAKDTHIPADQVDAIKAALADAGTRHEVVVYDDAEHGFHCDQRASYHEESAKDAWEKTKTLFAEELRG